MPDQQAAPHQEDTVTMPISDPLGEVRAADPELSALIDRDMARQRNTLVMIASENYVSPAVMQAMGSALTNKYAEGTPRHRWYNGCRIVDEVEQLAIDRARALFGAEHANGQPHAGSQANAAAYMALLELGTGAGHGPQPWWPPDSRFAPELFGAGLSLCPLWRRG